MNVDLHCHSTNSDGTWNVRSILLEAQRKGIKVLSLTDHDNLKGSQEAFEINSQDRLFSGTLIWGIEISTKVLGETVHLLAYFPQMPKDPELLEALEEIRESRVGRMKQMIKLANEHGLHVTFEEVLQEAQKGSEGGEQHADVISRPHLARVFVQKGYAKSVEDAFQKYLGDGKPLYTKRFTLKFPDWIQLIHANFGLAVWAHPMFNLDANLSKIKEIAHVIIQNKVDGIELIYQYEGKYPVGQETVKKGTELLQKLVHQHSLLLTSGGDFHGDVGVLGELNLEQKHWESFQRKLFKNA